MSDESNNLRKLAERSIEGQKPSWKNALTRGLIGKGQSQGVDLTKDQLTMSDSEKLNYARGVIAMLAKELGEPMKLRVNGQVYWVDRYGNETLDQDNAERFEGMLRNREFGTFSGKKLDGVNDDIEHLRGVVYDIVSLLKKPLKVDNIWFDSQGTIVDDMNFERFETSF